MGYTKNENGDLVIVQEEAEIVRLIFKLYLEGYSAKKISQYLEENGIKTATGQDKWYDSVIFKMLRNEKYMGDALLQKTYTDEFDERYRRIAEEINTLKEEQIEARRKKKLADSYEQRLKDMDSFLEKQTCQIPEFDNDLVRRLIASIKVVSAEKLIIQFQSGIVMEQEIRYE